ncbi:hypothetical protein PGIGA_G00075930 [Pangasianodon gigas]|uniref:Uncharacterized protein n=1 Tax=Pangasianodon gigas TaxID=30993 RepID=A0ACC5X941_PANGG|nr:hypothetical protein [Pangasianodon gigas]
MQLTVVFACLVISAASAAQSDSTVACYMDAPMQHMFFTVDPFLCTHIIYSTAYIGDDLSLKTLSLDVDPFSSMLKMLKDRNPALKMLLGVGVKQTRLEVLSQQQITLDNFINSTLKYVKKNNYDGVELTWLENDTDETLRNTETLTSFIKELRGWIDQADNKSLLVSVSLLDQSNHISTRIDKKTLSQYVDFICLLPLSLNNVQIDNTVKYWQDQVDPKKLILALPAIVQQPRKRQNSSQSRIVGINPERKVEQMNGPGLIIAKQVCQAIKSGQKELKTLTKLESSQSHGEDVSWLLQKGLGGMVTTGILTMGIVITGMATMDIVITGIVTMGIVIMGMVTMGIVIMGMVTMGIVTTGMVIMGIVITGMVTMGIVITGMVTMGIVITDTIITDTITTDIGTMGMATIVTMLTVITFRKSVCIMVIINRSN